MVEIRTAKNCGFCFGVRKAVDVLLGEMAEAEKDGGRAIYLMGKIIHNDNFIRQIISGGVIIIDDYGDTGRICDNSVIVIRAHGIPKTVFERLKEMREQKNLKIVDATCECVRKMHKIAEENTNQNTFSLILGDKTHPEIIALDSYTNGERQILRNFEELTGDFDLTEILNKNIKKLIILAQTTHNIKDYIKCRDYIKEKCVGTVTEAVFFDTICGATGKMQAEAEFLAKESDVMIVVGDQSSSNTKKLYEICEKNCANSFIVETSEQLPFNILKNNLKDLKDSKDSKKGKDAVRVSITAGASTPDSIIMEVKKIMTDNINNTENGGIIENIEERAVVSENADVVVGVDENVNENKNENNNIDSTNVNDDDKSFAELLDETFATLSRGDRIKGIISYISDGEIHVDLGYKYTGILAFDEVTDDSSVDLKEMFKVGDEIETQVIKTNDQEGIALLSKKRIDSSDTWDKIIQFHEEGTVVEGKVVQVVNGGIIVLIDSIKVFVPASHADVSKDTDLQTLIGKKVKVKVIDINTVKRRAIASIRNASMEERKANEDKIWSEVEINKKYEGVVKSIANYGAFVDIGGIDGMVHLSELSWSRIKHPTEIVQIGDKIQVYIKDFDTEKRRISLGYKDASENPWTKFTAETKVGDVVDVKILNTTPFGAFAEIVPGVDGLIHISQIANKKISKPSEILNIGDIVQVKITEINPEAKKISLSIRALLEPEQIPETATADIDDIDINIEPEAVEIITETKEKAEAVAEIEIEIEPEIKVEAVANGSLEEPVGTSDPVEAPESSEVPEITEAVEAPVEKEKENKENAEDETKENAGEEIKKVKRTRKPKVKEDSEVKEIKEDKE
ncbi:MAG: 4-hydroxy-3-methylbut-2-enyl diphosphate reductase [Oscillospiraceae bacterium]|nr:4-hydroxy-3-methylbut-2-enyl diphosphate reductase [Oscillospiraceae bacterium]